MNNAQKQFNEEIERMISKKLGEDISVKVNLVYKPNLPELYGISFQEKSSNISPIIYLNSFYIEYQNGAEMDWIVDEILRVFDEHRKSNVNFDTSFFTNFDSISSRIACKVINAKMNKKYLESGIAHTLILDDELAVIYYVLVQSDLEGNATITIRDDHLAIWNKSIEEINGLAISQTPALMGVVLKDICSVLREMLKNELAKDMNVDEATMENLLFQMMEDAINPKIYVLSNDSMVNGACLAYLYPEKLKSFLKEIGSKKAVILPSSIHETIIVPVDEMESNIFSEMVHEVNATQLKQEEILSERPCLFDATNNTYIWI